MTVSVAVMMHPTRVQHTEYLQHHLGDPKVITDRGLGIWDTCARAWLAFDPSATHHIVVQDDAILCEGFMDKAANVLDGRLAVSFYWGNRKDYRKVAAAGMVAGFIRTTLHWGVAVGLHTSLIPAMVAHGNTLPANLPDDARIKSFLKASGISVHYPMPSLADHRAEPSLVTGLVQPGRRAYRFIDEGKHDER